jgi:hypothetical protein
MAKGFVRYTVVWISQNLAIPFWSIGHIHLMTTVYEDVIEIISSIGMNAIVAIGFYISYKEDGRRSIHDKRPGKGCTVEIKYPPGKNR